MTAAAFGALLSHWRRSPFQALTLALGLALATALWSGVQAINTEARISYDRAAQAIGGRRPILTSPGGVPLETFVILRRAGWLVTPVVEGWIDGGSGSGVRLIGIDPLTAPPEMGAAGIALGDGLADFLLPPGRLIAAPDTAARLTAPEFPPVEVSASAAPGLALTDIHVAARLLDLGETVSHLVVLSENVDRPIAEIAPALTLEPRSTGGDVARLTDSFHLNLTAFGFLSFAVGLFIVHGAIGLAFEQRRGMFRTLRALGVPGARLTALVAAELLVFALVSGTAGLVLGYFVAAALIPDVAATLRGLYGVPVEGALSLRPGWWAAGLAMALAGITVAAAGVLWKTRTLPVLAPAQPRAWARASDRTIRAQIAAAAALALVAVLAAAFGTGLIAGFVLLGAMLIAAALLLPACLATITAIGGRAARSVLAEWFWADTRQQIPGLSLALMALLLAIAANIGVGTMVSSFRLTFIGWLDQRLASELYVTAATPDQAADLTAWLAPRADAILPIWSVEGNLAGAPGEVFGVVDDPTYRENWPLLTALPGVWDRITTSDAALVNEQLARRADLTLGDPVTLPDGSAVPIVGIYSDYGNPEGQAIIGLDTLTTLFPDVERLRYGVRIAPDRVSGLQDALIDDFGLDPGQMTDQASLKALSLRIFERTFAVTGALNVLTLGIAGFAVFAALATLSSMRLPQLAPIWAAGLTRRRIATLEVARAAALAAITFLLAIPVGLILAWVLLAVVNVAAFGWRLPMYVFPADWAGLGALAVLAGAAASLWPASQLARRSPADLLRIFSCER